MAIYLSLERLGGRIVSCFTRPHKPKKKPKTSALPRVRGRGGFLSRKKIPRLRGGLAVGNQPRGRLKHVSNFHLIFSTGTRMEPSGEQSQGSSSTPTRTPTRTRCIVIFGISLFCRLLIMLLLRLLSALLLLSSAITAQREPIYNPRGVRCFVCQTEERQISASKFKKTQSK